MGIVFSGRSFCKNLDEWCNQEKRILIITGYEDTARAPAGRNFSESFDALFVSLDFFPRALPFSRILEQFKEGQLVIEGSPDVFLQQSDLSDCAVIITDSSFFSSIYRTAKRNLKRDWRSISHVSSMYKFVATNLAIHRQLKRLAVRLK